MTFPNGGQRDESNPNRSVGRASLNPDEDPANFPNLSPEQFALALRDRAAFDAMYPLKLHDMSTLRGV